MKKNLKGSLILLLAALIWGFAFAAQSSAADSVGPFTFNAVRSCVGALFLVGVIAVRAGITKQPIIPAESQEKKGILLGGISCGVALFLAANFQQFGIWAYPDGVAASGRSGFLTAMYVVMVAFVGCFSGKKLHPIIPAAAVVAVLGMYMLCMSGGISGLYLGDLLCLICAVCFTGHILVVDRFSAFDGIKISCIQFFTVGVLSGICMLAFEEVSMSSILSAWLPILYTGVCSSGIAYTLQIIGQKKAEPAVASIVMSLESVFAGVGGWLVLGEKLSARELGGCALVFAAVILAQVPDFIKKQT